MTKQIHSATKSFSLGSDSVLGSDDALDDLRNGEREAFGRFFETYRSGVYSFVSRLMRGHGDAAAITREVFVRAYRKILLHDGAIDLRPWVYGVAFDASREHLASLPGAQALRAPLHEPEAALDADQQSDLARRFRQASEGLSDRDLAVLLLNDVHGLSYGETAAVVGVSTEAAKTLLFRAGERFRGAFEALSGKQTVATCRFAEQEAATSVGRGLSADDTRRLRDHARYCETCRTTTSTWGPGAAGLALFVGDAPLPQALQKVPVFGTWAAPVAVPLTADTKAVAGRGAVVGALVRLRAVVGSKATAYAVAAVCLAALVGVVMYGSHRELQRVILFVPRPAASTAVVAPHAQPNVAVVHHAVRQGVRKAARVAQPAHGLAVASTAPIATAKLTSVRSSGAARTGDSDTGSGGTPASTAGGTGATTGAAGSTAAGSTPTGGGGSSTTAGHSAGTSVASAVSTAVGTAVTAGPSPSAHDGRAARSHYRVGHDGQPRHPARSAAQPRPRSGSHGARSRSGNGATNGAGRHRNGGGRGQTAHASRGSRAGSSRGRGHRGSGAGRSHSRAHGGRSRRR